MSLNLGPVAFDAIFKLKEHPDWRKIVEGLDEAKTKFMHLAIEGPIEGRVDATAYARALRDLSAYIEQVEKPPVPGNRPPRSPVRNRVNE